MGKWMRRVVRHMGLTFVAAGGVLTGLSCGGGDVTAPTTGTIEITATTSGPEPDADGYTVSIDDGAETPLGANATLQRDDLDPGNHSVRLSGLAGNCSVQGTNPRSVTVSGGATAEVSFAVTCTAATGSLEITTTTTGNAPDLDGYTVAVDNAAPQTIGATATLTLPGVSPGNHQVTLGGLATDCRVEGNNPRSVTVTAGATTRLAFSLDCHTPLIAFTSDRDGNSEIYVMRADGSGQTRLTNTPENEFRPAWSADGTKIAFDRHADIYVMNADGSSQTKLTHSESASSPTWSPDGTKIAFRTSVDVTEYASFDQIMIMNADGTGTPQVASGLGDRASLDWSRDGSRIAFTAWPEEALHMPPWIGVIYTDGSEEGVIEGGHGTCRYGPAWSTDGRIAFSSAPVDPEDDTGDDCWEDNEIYVMNPGGGGAIQLTNNSENDSDPAWSRDDRKIAFTRYRDGNSDIYVMNADGSGETRLTNHPALDSDPSWSP